MSSRFTKDPYSVSFQEVDSRVTASLKAEADLKRKTEKLQRELQNCLLAHHREKTELHDFLADLRGPLGPLVVRTRKHSLGRGGGAGGTTSRAVGRKPKSEPGRRQSEPAPPVDHFPAFTLRDPFAWVGDDGDDSDDDSSDAATALSHKKDVECVPVETSQDNNPTRTRKTSVFETTSSRPRFDRLPLIKPSSKMGPANSADIRSAAKYDRCPALTGPGTAGKGDPASEEEQSNETSRPRLTVSTLANLNIGSSDIRRRIQSWCDSITVELFPFAESERLLKSEATDENQNQQADGRPLNGDSRPLNGDVRPPNPPKITITSADASPAKRDIYTNNNKEALRDSTHSRAGSKPTLKSPTANNQTITKSHFFPPNFVDDFSQPDNGQFPSARTEPLPPGSPAKSIKAMSLNHNAGKVAANTPRRLSKVTATDLRVISKSMQSFHTCKVYRGRNSIPSASTDSKTFEDLARAQYRLVKRQRVRARQQGASYDFGERVDAQIKKRDSARWSM